MESTQGNSLLQLSLSQASKNVMFLFYLLCFFLYKIGEQVDGTGSAQGGLALVGGGGGGAGVGV
jgi:hypothetical protein